MRLTEYAKVKIKIKTNLLLHFAKTDEVPKYINLEILAIVPLFLYTVAVKNLEIVCFD